MALAKEMRGELPDDSFTLERIGLNHSIEAIEAGLLGR